MASWDASCQSKHGDPRVCQGITGMRLFVHFIAAEHDVAGNLCRPCLGGGWILERSFQHIEDGMLSGRGLEVARRLQQVHVRRR